MNNQELIDDLINLLVEEYIADCDKTNCKIVQAYEDEDYNLSIFLYANSGLASQAFFDIYKNLHPSFFNRFITDNLSS